MNRPEGSNNRFLLGAGLAPSTKLKYSKAVSLFVTWCDEHNFSPKTFSQLDDLLTDYLHELYEINDGKLKSLASETLYGIVSKLPRSQGKLLTAQSCIKNSMKLRPSQSYPPLTWELTVLIAIQMVRNKALRAAIGTLLAFDCFLRINELLSLKKSDIADAGDNRIGANFAGMALRLRTTKTGKNQWVEVDNPQIRKLVRLLVLTCNERENLFDITATNFRKLFKNVCSQLHLSSSYVPHSLRHGGATKWHLDGKSINDIIQRGRWASNKSATRYIQSGRALLLTVHHPQGLTYAGHTLSNNLLTSIKFSLPQQH
jgi:integrase